MSPFRRLCCGSLETIVDLLDVYSATQLLAADPRLAGPCRAAMARKLEAARPFADEVREALEVAIALMEGFEAQDTGAACAVGETTYLSFDNERPDACARPLASILQMTRRAQKIAVHDGRRWAWTAMATATGVMVESGAVGVPRQSRSYVELRLVDGRLTRVERVAGAYAPLADAHLIVLCALLS